MTNELKSVPNVENMRLEWVEPQVRQMDVAETASQPGFGADGETAYADCTFS